VIAAAHRDNVLLDAINGVAGVGTTVAAHVRNLPARKLWIAFAVRSSGILSVDAGARTALQKGGTSLLAAGVISSQGEFDVDDAVEIADDSGEVFAKGLVRMSSKTLTEAAGHSRSELPSEVPAQVIHADDLVILP
jgi:glutamate 5-kinase